MNKYKYIYGPVFSWRLGRSLGIDLISGEAKQCTYDCLYCQLGRQVNLNNTRSVFVPTAEIIKEIKNLPPVKIDYITFSGTGEPTLAANLGETILAIKKIRDNKIAVITNSSLMNIKEVRKELSLADFVMAKLDAYSQQSFEMINNPIDTIKFKDIVEGLKQFKKEYNKKFAIQIMFIDKNKDEVKKIADLCRQIGPTEVQINTPLRPTGVKPLLKKDIEQIVAYFSGMNTVSVYDEGKKEVEPLAKEETLKRRGTI